MYLIQYQFVKQTYREGYGLRINSPHDKPLYEVLNPWADVDPVQPRGITAFTMAWNTDIQASTASTSPLIISNKIANSFPGAKLQSSVLAVQSMIRTFFSLPFSGQYPDDTPKNLLPN